MDPKQRIIWVAKPAAFVLCLMPAVLLVYDAVRDDLGANPVEAVRRWTGDWTLRFLLITLAVTPLRRLTGWTALMRFRRMLGLFAFFYACLHFVSYIWLDQFFNVGEIVKDVTKRPFITAGFASFLLMIPLAATSTGAMVRRLGARRWQRLHRAVYVVGIGGLLHFFWLVKSDLTQPLVHGVLLCALLGYRLVIKVRRANDPRAGVRPKKLAAHETFDRA